MISASNILTLSLKLSAIAFVTYISISYLFFIFTPFNFKYRKENFVSTNMTILMQPVMDVFGDGKVSHWYDWENVIKSRIDLSLPELTLKSDTEQYRKFTFAGSFKNAAASLGGVRQAAIIEPENYSGYWSLAFCNKQDKICQRGNILHKGKIKIILDGECDLWGFTESGKYISLKLVKLVDRSDSKDILFI